MDNYQSHIILDKNSGVFYYSVSELSSLLNIRCSTLSRRLRGKLKNNTNYCIV